MRKYVLAAGLVGALGLASFTLSAQNANDNPAEKSGQTQGHHKHRGRHMGGLKKLNLTADQKAKLEPIFKSQREQMTVIRNDSSLSQDQRRQKLMDLRQSMSQQMASVLTSEQQQQLEQMRQARHERFEKHKANQSGTAAPQSN